MKLSTKLLLAVLTLTVFALVGTNLVLKAEYEKTNFADPFWNYERVPLARFQHVSLSSSARYPVEIRQSTGVPMLYVSRNWKDSLHIEPNRDTLQIRFQDGYPIEAYRSGPHNDVRDMKALLVLVVPDLRSLTVQQQSWLRLQGTRLDSLDLRASAYAAVNLIDTRVDELRLALTDSAWVDLQPRCRVGTLTVDAAGKSTLQLRAESVGRFQPVIRDERVELHLSGQALTEFVKSQETSRGATAPRDNNF